MTACGVAMTLTIFNNGVATLIGIGSASILSRALGKGDQKTVDKIMGNLIFWVILFSAIITVGGIILAPHSYLWLAQQVKSKPMVSDT